MSFLDKLPEKVRFEMEKWNLQYGENTEVHPVSDEYGEYVIAEIDPDNNYCPEKREKIARLIAAAPDLLVALEHIAENGCIGCGKVADQAITKAEKR